MIARGLILLGALLVFGGVNWQIAHKERLRANGETVFLELMPVDPRSLIQGDYMALNFALVRQIEGASPIGSGAAVVTFDDKRIGRFVKIDSGGPLEPGQARIRFRIRAGAIWLGTNAFFFEEGDAARYQGARFGEFRVDGSGEALLVDMRGPGLQLMPRKP